MTTLLEAVVVVAAFVVLLFGIAQSMKLVVWSIAEWRRTARPMTRDEANTWWLVFVLLMTAGAVTTLGLLTLFLLGMFPRL